MCPALRDPSTGHGGARLQGVQLVSHGQGGGEQQQAAGSGAQAAGGAPASCPAGAAPGEDAPGAVPGLGVPESYQEQAR